MIAKAKAISHGINDIRYITGESNCKKHPEKIYWVYDNLLPSQFDAMGIWNSMQLTLSQFNPIKNSTIRIELSPSPEHTNDFTIDDWQKLWLDFAREFDRQVFKDKNGKVRHGQTNLANSKYTVWLHMESQSGIPHLHAAVCRMDEDGHINNDHNIHLRAQWAVERVTKERGWTTAKEIRKDNLPQVTRTCMNILKSMSSWSWEEYKDALIRKGYKVHERKDQEGNIHGYALIKGNTKYKASELGVGRNLMFSKLPSTWQKLHNQQKAAPLDNNKTKQTPQETKPSVSIDYTKYETEHPNTVLYRLTHEGNDYRFYIPDKVLTHFNDDFDYRSTSNSDELTDMAVAIFVGLLGGPTVITGSGGGGSQSDLPWRDKDDDDLLWARKCARAASRILGKKPRTGIKR